MKKTRLSIDGECLSELKKWFANYVESFRSDDPEIQRNIDLKEKHTERVCREISYIGEQSGLNGDESRLAETIALLHDVGRFEQYARYKTFMDKDSENHAELSVKTIERFGVLDSFDDLAKDIAVRAIRLHNRAFLPPEEPEPFLFYAKLIRDADKLDIWKVVIDYYYRKDERRNAAIELDLPDTAGFSEKICDSLKNKRIVNIEDVKNLNDFKLLQTGWIFDINFKPTLDRIRERRYLEKMRGVLPESKEIDEIFDIAEGFCFR